MSVFPLSIDGRLLVWTVGEYEVTVSEEARFIFIAAFLCNIVNEKGNVLHLSIGQREGRVLPFDHLEIIARVCVCVYTCCNSNPE